MKCHEHLDKPQGMTPLTLIDQSIDDRDEREDAAAGCAPTDSEGAFFPNKPGKPRCLNTPALAVAVDAADSSLRCSDVGVRSSSKANDAASRLDADAEVAEDVEGAQSCGPVETPVIPSYPSGWKPASRCRDSRSAERTVTTPCRDLSKFALNFVIPYISIFLVKPHPKFDTMLAVVFW